MRALWRKSNFIPVPPPPPSPRGYRYLNENRQFSGRLRRTKSVRADRALCIAYANTYTYRIHTVSSGLSAFYLCR